MKHNAFSNSNKTKLNVNLGDLSKSPNSRKTISFSCKKREERE